MRATATHLMPKASNAIIDMTPPTAAWRKALPRAQTLVRKMAVAALQHGTKKTRATRRLPPEVSIVLTTDAAVRRLNCVYRGKDKPTNVLSFPADVPPGTSGLLGDVVIAYGVAARESRAESKELQAHLAHLVVHGVLHLLGYDHEQDKDAVVMERLESDIMARMGFADPYAFLPPKRQGTPARKSRGVVRKRSP
jgi:probable rRNA maturation factor